MGSSAGGLTEYEQFFKQMEITEEMVFVLIQHLAPDGDRMLPDILSRKITTEVVQAEDGMKLQGGAIYTIPPGYYLDLDQEAGTFRLLPREDQTFFMPVDYFFRAMSQYAGTQAIGIVLSGTGSDGALGVREIKGAGGLVLAQQPSSAEYDGMPTSAIRTGQTDAVLEVDAMPELLRNYVGRENHAGEQPGPNEATPTEHKDAVKLILELVKSHSGHDFSQYKPNTIYRRLDRRMTVRQMENLEAYYEVLQSDPDELQRLFRELLIVVTSFFRDREIFDYLEQTIVPKVVQEARNDQLRIWVPGCATGEEAYSLTMLFKRYLEQHNLHYELKVFASDLDNVALRTAREAFYSNNIAADIPEDLLNRYFLKEQGGFRVKNSLREKVIFAQHNVVQDPPFSRLDLISCRNLLIYLNRNLQEKALLIFHYALKREGKLVLGKSETLGHHASYFSTLHQKYKVFEKVESQEAARKVWRLNYDVQKKTNQGHVSGSSDALAQAVRAYLLHHHTPPAAVINQEGEMLYTQGAAGKFFEHTTGPVSIHIQKLAREELRFALSNLIRQAYNKQQEAREVVWLRGEEGQREYLQLIAAPLTGYEENPNLLIVLFKQDFPDKPLSRELEEDQSRDETIQALRRELSEKEDSLQNTIEELETTNEELKSSNEEAQSANEELQSSNEELETSKMELQSVNHALNKTNEELHEKIDALNRTNNYLENLNIATQIATVFLDKELKIFYFTPAIHKIMELMEGDIGRSIQQFTNKIEDGHLVDDAREVIRTLIPREKEVHTGEDQYFWMRIVPYRTLEDKIEGVVITFTDITELKRREAQLESYRERIEDKDTFMAIIGHDLRNGIGNLRQVAELLIDPDQLDEESFRELLEAQYGQAKNTEQLLDNLLHWARVHQGRVRYQPQRLHLNTLANEAVEAVAYEARQKGVHLRKKYGGNYHVQADAEMLRLIIRNLLSNAVNFTAEGSEVRIELRKEGEGQVLVAIEDQGVGMEPEKLDGILGSEGDIRSEQGTEGESGSGLGLKLCHQFLEHHGTQLYGTSTPGQGTRLWFFLPQEA